MHRVRVFVVLMCVSFGFRGLLHAQNIVISPNDTIQVAGSMEDLETLTIFLQNHTPSAVVFKWKKLSEYLPANWEAAVCDNKICYAGLEDSGTMNPVDSSESAFLLLHITSKVNFGTATVRYVVWDEQNPQWTDTLSYILRVDPVSGIVNENKEAGFRVYPNPACRNLYIQSNDPGIFHYQIADIRGRIMEMGIGMTGELSLRTDRYNSGLYVVSIRKRELPVQRFKIVIKN